MTQIEAVALYSGLFVLLFIGLKLNAGRVRVSEQVNFGDGGNDPMRQAMRVQGNAVEDVPITLLGLYGLAALAAPVMLIHILGGSFLLFRIAHAFTLGSGTGSGLGRMIGTLGTLLVMLVTGGAAIWFALT
ncbi:MAPEG family protein [Hyphomonas sp. FCG-A18]|uniref:MAPEG family protein n=1 Tax=Hyphomonas sp. FCG-A18 TaxID=3080019 RepID=UPI002B2A1700|nr:MAPEG family protein [Hyphomonas sp. FCG-A18]